MKISETFSKGLRITAVFLLAGASVGQAAVVPFASRASFDLAFPGAVEETWDGFAAGTVFPDGTTAGGITYSTTGPDAFVTSNFLNTTDPNSLGSTSGEFFSAGNDPTFAFSAALSAFGIDINTFATAPGSYTATTNLGDVIPSFFDPFPGFFTGQFIGFSSDMAFTSVTIAAPGGFAYTLDTLRAVAGTTAVPEPSSLALLSLGLFGIAALRRRWASRPRPFLP